MIARGSNQHVYRKTLGLRVEAQRDVWFLLFLALLAVFLGSTLRRNNPDCQSDWMTKCLLFPVVSPISNSKPEQVSAEENDRRLDYAYAKLELEQIKKEANEPTTKNIIATIVETWEEEGTQTVFEAIHIAKSESGLRPNAINYNCVYTVNGKQIYTSCQKQDRSKAWSVDCGIFQINVAGQVCPKELFDPKTNISRAYKMFQKRGWNPWVAAKTLGYAK